MKFLLTAINAKYIHSNLGVYSLKKYAESASSGEYGITIEIAEYTINHPVSQILQDIYRRRPDIIGFSCYIWNLDYVWELVHDLHKILPGTDIWLGGPEVSFDARQILEREPEVLGVMKGEGETVFVELLTGYRLLGSSVQQWQQRRLEKKQEEFRTAEWRAFWKKLHQLSGVAFRGEDEGIQDNAIRAAETLSQIPFPYTDLSEMEHRIIYYESSRGCPFSCSYCLSSIDKSVRFRDLKLVKQELDFFLDRRVPQVKFVDRTFNCKKEHAMIIWQHILDHDNGVTNFHFEVAADQMEEEELKLLEKMRPGLIQLEIGVQSTNPDTIREIHRQMDLNQLRRAVKRINQGHNIHQHLDLIAGLPFEGYESFHRSFNEVYEMEPEQLQLGFLKVLKGSYMYDMAEKYELVYQEKPPYEVLSTRWISYEELCRLKGIEAMVEVYYNSGQFIHTLRRLMQELTDPFAFYEQLAQYYENRGLNGRNHTRLARYDFLHDFIRELSGDKGKYWQDQLEDTLVFDCYLRENCKSRPGFALDLTPYKDKIRNLVPEMRKLGRQVHVEVLRSKEIWLFDYRNRDPLTGNASVTQLE
ncbi:MAG: B12-binding domain-containing radical SAM protein [Lachnospiraceae bacterium]|nr:B12-binding domain-containing radical SAM protein [Lachnospiraceae bacterium]